MMKKWLIPLMLFLFFSAAPAAQAACVWVDGQELDTVEQGKKQYLQLRALSAAAAVPLLWLGAEETGVWLRADSAAAFSLDLAAVFVQDETGMPARQSCGAPLLLEDRIYVPTDMLPYLGIALIEDEVGRQLLFPLESIRAGDAAAAAPLLAAVREAKQPAEQLFAGYTTAFNAANVGRTVNLSLAAAAINGCAIEPGGEFSFNDAVGERTAGRGYQRATVFVQGEAAEDYGGGICQVSSTLYNAVLAAGLAVTERWPHSLPVSYVPAGRDATVSYGSLDFCFENSSSWELVIRTRVRGGRLTVELWQPQEK